MKEKRYFYDKELDVNKNVVIDGEEFHHLTTVMRTRVNDNIVLINNDGYFYFGKVTKVEKKFAEISIFDKKKSENEPKIELDLYQALAKGDKLSLIMQKITEIGASKLCLFHSKYTDVKENTTKGERLENISISAAKQCGRATLTKIEGIFSIDEVAKSIKTYDKFYVTYENEDNKTLVNELLKNKNIKKIAIMVGAEGGFSNDEIEKLKENGAEIVSLGNRILRTETAAILSTSLAMQILENN